MTPHEKIEAYYRLFYAPTRAALDELIDEAFSAVDGPIGLDIQGKEALWEMVKANVDRPPRDIDIGCEEYIGDESGGVMRWTWQAPGSIAALYGLPSVEGSCEVHGLGHFSFKDGKIASLVEYWDGAELLRFLGAAVPRPAARAAAAAE